MISSIEGKIIKKGINNLVISVGGFGIEVKVPLKTLEASPPVGSKVSLFTYLHLREDALSLYGFESEDERELFISLLSVSGFGAAKALAVLSVYSCERFEEIIRNQDIDSLTRIPGLGKKGAQRLVLEMRDKVGLPAELSASLDSPAKVAFEEAYEALIQLGYSALEARKALEEIKTKPGVESLGAAELIQSALKNIGSRI